MVNLLLKGCDGHWHLSQQQQEQFPYLRWTVITQAHGVLLGVFLEFAADSVSDMSSLLGYISIMIEIELS